MHKLYWIHFPHHQNPLVDGYIGVTKRKPENRMQEHLQRNKKIPAGVVMTVIAEGLTEDEVLWLEMWFRPRWKMGWNTAPGGKIRRRPKGIHTSGWKWRADAKRDGSKGKKNGMFGRVGSEHPRYKPFVIDGVRYEKIGDAHKARGESVGNLYRRLNSEKWPNYSYIEQEKAAPVGAAS